MRTEQFIAGHWRAGSAEKVLIDRNPFTGAEIGSFTIADVDDVDEAYRAAAAAQREWRAENPYIQRDVFDKAIAYVRDHIDEISDLIVAELGGTRLKAAFEIGLVIDLLREAGTLPLRMGGHFLPSPIANKENRLYREPVGVIGVMSPFNFPFFLGMKSVAPALGTGNGVVLKPHEDTPISGGTLIGQIFEAAGVPPGLINVVVTEIASIGDAFIEHPVPRMLSFTGSAAVGRHVAEVAARGFKRVVVEAGGNSALIVLHDADLELAVDAAVFSRFTHQGQVCMSANRVLVHQSLYQEFLDRYVAKVASLPVGDPADPNTVIGPLINQRQADALNGLVERGIGEGAKAILRGPVEGTLFSPTILVEVTPDMTVMQEELFGPVVCIVPFGSDDEAVAIANNTRYGLSGAVHTRDTTYGVILARRIETGMIHINDATIHDEPIVAFGGEKQSGLGRLNGHHSLDAFTTTKWISINYGRRQFPY